MYATNLALTGILSPDHPARSESLYRLSYPAQDWSKQIEIEDEKYSKIIFFSI
jgi:hypothetical protein